MAACIPCVPPCCLPAFFVLAKAAPNRIHGEDAGVADGPHILPDASTHTWTLDYQPGSPSSITVSLDGKTTTFTMPDEHFAHGASFNRFGIITTQIDGNMEIIYFDDLTYTVKQ